MYIYITYIYNIYIYVSKSKPIGTRDVLNDDWAPFIRALNSGLEARSLKTEAINLKIEILTEA